MSYIESDVFPPRSCSFVDALGVPKRWQPWKAGGKPWESRAYGCREACMRLLGASGTLGWSRQCLPIGTSLTWQLLPLASVISGGIVMSGTGRGLLDGTGGLPARESASPSADHNGPNLHTAPGKNRYTPKYTDWRTIYWVARAACPPVSSRAAAIISSAP